MAKKVAKKASKTKVRKKGTVITWIHAEEEIIIAGGGLVVILMIFMFLF